VHYVFLAELDGKYSRAANTHPRTEGFEHQRYQIIPVLQHVAVCCSAMQCVAVCFSVL